MKGIAGVLATLDDSSDKPPKIELIAPSDPELASMPVEDRGEFLYGLRIKGFKVDQLAKRYKVDRSTIYRWIKDYMQAFRDDFEQQTKADILTEELVFLEHLQEVSLYEMQRADYDEPTGAKTSSVDSKMVKLNFLKAVLQIRQTRQNLLLNIGILPKQPERIYHKMADEKRDEDKEAGRAEKSPDEMKANILRLLSQAPSLT